MLFKDIVGQEATASQLIQAVKAQRISHAQLFAETTGSGALPLALAYCQFVLCENPSETDSCGKCASCLQVQKLTHPDIHFEYPLIKRDSNHKPYSIEEIDTWRQQLISTQGYLGIEQWSECIRKDKKVATFYESQLEDFLAFVNKKPYQADYKFVFIWQADRMPLTYANKILKLLEEPPLNTIILLITDKPNKLLETIRSRCQQVVVPKVPNQSVEQFLVQHYQKTPQVAAKLAKAFSGDLIKLNHTLQQEGNQQMFEWFTRLMRLCYSARTKLPELIQLAKELSETGREQQQQFIQYAINLIRENFMLNIQREDLSFMVDEEYAFSQKFALFIRETNIMDFYQALNKASAHIAQNVNAKLVFFDLSMQFSVILAKTKPLV